jgi:EamA domain-containing membrane protein RarD
MDKEEIEDRERSIMVLGKIQYFFPIVFFLLAFVFYVHDKVDPRLAWIFFAVGVMEYFLIGMLVDSRKKKLEADTATG